MLLLPANYKYPLNPIVSLRRNKAISFIEGNGRIKQKEQRQKVRLRKRLKESGKGEREVEKGR